MRGGFAVIAAAPEPTNEARSKDEDVVAVMQVNKGKWETPVVEMMEPDRVLAEDLSTLRAGGGNSLILGNVTTGTVSGTLANTTPGFTMSSGTFSFNVDLATGNVSNAIMQASGLDGGGSAGFSLSGGTGQVTPAALGISNFTGTVTAGGITRQVGQPTLMSSATGMDITRVGNAVSGNYQVRYQNLPVGTLFSSGTFNGSRTR
jgi:hypothetical protein